MSVLDAIIKAESAGDPNARNRRSSATGLGQFIDSTWLNTVKQHRPDLMQGRSAADVLAMRTDPTISREMLARHTEDNQRGLRSAGIDPTPGNTYLAHFAGLGGARSLMQAPDDADAGSILGGKVVAANPFLRGMTVADVRRWADTKGAGRSGSITRSGGSPSGGSEGGGDDAGAMRAAIREFFGVQDDNEARQALDGLMTHLAEQAGIEQQQAIVDSNRG